MFDLGTYLPYLINRAGVRIATAFTQELVRFDISLAMWRVLAVLWQHGSQRLGEVADRTSMEASTLSRLIGQMQAKGLVSRVRSGADARAVAVSLTARGRTLTRKIIPIALRYETVSVQGFTPAETDALKRLLVRVYANMAAFDKVPSPRRRSNGKAASAPPP